jgi:hypothetical protein
MTASHNLPTEAGNYSQPDTVAAPADVVKLTAAVDALGLPLGKLRRLVKEGMPTVRRASAKGGRGSTTWLHLPTCRQWLAARVAAGQPVEALLLQLASELPAVVGAALDVAGRVLDTPAKAELLRMLPGVWFLASTAIHDYLIGEHGCPEQRDLGPRDLPPALARLLDSELQSKR